jgi:hypothetical protein
VEEIQLKCNRRGKHSFTPSSFLRAFLSRIFRLNRKISYGMRMDIERVEHNNLTSHYDSRTNPHFYVGKKVKGFKLAG